MPNFHKQQKGNNQTLKKMLKIHFLFAGILFLSNIAIAQNAKLILQQTYDKCQSVQNGYYEMTRYMKFMSSKDTSKSTFYCNFKKLPDDSLFSSAFHYYNYWQDTIKFDVMYTGDDFITASSKDSTATIMSKSKWAAEIKLRAHNYKFYSPLTNKKSSPLVHDSDFVDNKHRFKFLGEDTINGMACYRIQVNKIPENDSTEMMKTMRQEYHYWINKSDSIPIQYTIAFDLEMNGDTMFQFEKNVLNRYELNKFQNRKLLTFYSLPTYYKKVDFVPYQSPELLKLETIAPDWELLSLTDEKISLKSLKGQLVLVDFFYKSCYPCMQALPMLQSFHEKYQAKGLRIVGIDPYDKKEDDIASFLAKRGVSYPVLLGGNDVAKAYHVSGYPTIYIIDKTGKIILSKEGHGKDSEKELEEFILKNLD